MGARRDRRCNSVDARGGIRESAEGQIRGGASLGGAAPRRGCVHVQLYGGGERDEYTSGAWGTLTGDWYAIVENVDFEVECLRAHFEEEGSDDARLATSSFFSVGEKSSRIFDFNATYALRDSGRYKMTYPSDDAAERRSWATVFDVGTFEGERWFGWYFCSDMLDITAKGYAAIYKEGSSASDAFVREARDKLKDAGLLRYGDFYRVKQFRCDDAF